MPKKKSFSDSHGKTSGIKSWPLSERPREILIEKGSEALSDAELIAILLRGGTKGKSAIALARNLLQKFGSLRQLLQASPKDLYNVSGMGPAKRAQIIAAREIGDRRLKEDAKGSDIVKSPEAAFNYVCSSMRDQKEEIFNGIFLNRRNEVIEISQLAFGTPDKVALYSRKIVERCLALGASKMILVHNHPSGSLEPGYKDIHLTQKLKDGLKFIDVELLDHIIIGRSNYYSMKKSGDMD